MLTARLMAALLGSAFINLNMTTCRSPGEGEKVPETDQAAPTRVKLQGVDTSDLSPREESQWSGHVSELLAPCSSVPVSVAKCVEEKRACEACKPAAEYLLQQVREGKTRAQVDVAYKERFAPDTVQEIDLTGSPSKGPAGAPITIVEWADFECPACKAAVPEIEEVMASAGDVRLVFKNFPLDIHENAEYAARAAMAADKQGKFWEMHKALFASQLPPTEATVLQLASDLGLDLEKFKKDQRSEEVADAVARDRKQGDAVKLRATPTLFINGRLFSYGTDLKAGLLDWIALERKLLPKGSQGAVAPSPKKEEAPASAPAGATDPSDAKPTDAPKGASKTAGAEEKPKTPSAPPQAEKAL
jgi:predicted DsbA family dithiol-disulfide isomerase